MLDFIKSKFTRANVIEEGKNFAVASLCTAYVGAGASYVKYLNNSRNEQQQQGPATWLELAPMLPITLALCYAAYRVSKVQPFSNEEQIVDLEKGIKLKAQ